MDSNPARCWASFLLQQVNQGYATLWLIFFLCMQGLKMHRLIKKSNYSKIQEHDDKTWKRNLRGKNSTFWSQEKKFDSLETAEATPPLTETESARSPSLPPSPSLTCFHLAPSLLFSLSLPLRAGPMCKVVRWQWIAFSLRTQRHRVRFSALPRFIDGTA